MKRSDKPTLLVLTSSFPRSPDDETCGYIRDFARSLAIEFNVIVLAPSDRRAGEWPSDAFTLIRSRSVLPFLPDPFQAGDDLNDLTRKGWLAGFAGMLSVLSFSARALLLALRADAICSNWLVPSGLAGAFISRVLRKRHVVVEHSGALHFLARTRGGRTIARLIVRASDRIITVSEDLKRKLIELCPAAATSVEAIPMGINVSPSRERIAAESSLNCIVPSTILFIGRLTEIKGLAVLLKAIDGLDGVRLIVAGDGETRDEHERFARQLSLNARFIGRIGASEREHLLSLCDVVVIPSIVLPNGRSEGTPVVCLEAMAAGRAVIASRIGGLAEVIHDGENGLLFEQNDDRMLREKLALVLSDETLRQKIAENARRSAAAYDWARIGSRYAAVIKTGLRKNDVIGNRGIEASSIRG